METNYSPNVPSQPQTNTMATTSLIAGIAGLVLTCLGIFTTAFFVGYFCACLGFLLGIGALVTGFMARSQIAQTGEAGSGMALAGMIMGGIQIALLLCSVVVIIILVILGPSISDVFSTINQSLK